MATEGSPVLTRALEDYLETIYEFARDHGYARVKDIASARKVQPGSVSPALKRLADLNLIKYERREYVELTEAGAIEARRVLSRHQILTRFLHEFLRIDAEVADRDACALEHQLSDEAMDGITKLFEFFTACPQSKSGFLELFHNCHLMNAANPRCKACTLPASDQPKLSIASLSPGQRGKVRNVSARPGIRQRLLDMGLLPDVEFSVERVAPGGDPVWIKLLGFQLALRREEAVGVQVEELP